MSRVGEVTDIAVNDGHATLRVTRLGKDYFLVMIYAAKIEEVQKLNGPSPIASIRTTLRGAAAIRSALGNK